MKYKNLILTGFMGTGKTTVGKLLSKELKYKFIDTDDMIMTRCNQTVVQIFETLGESAFREMERELAFELAQNEMQVISTGGKMMLNNQNATILGEKGKIFSLVAEPNEIIARISGDNKIKRPLLEVSDPMKRITALLKERRDGYAQFTQVNTTGITPEAVCKFIMKLFLQ